MIKTTGMRRKEENVQNRKAPRSWLTPSMTK